MNIPLPEPPTDNLYKFMAIFGLVLLVVGLALPVYIQYTEAISRADAMAKIRVIDTDMALSGALSVFKDIADDKVKTPEEQEKVRIKRDEFLVKNGQTIDELNKIQARSHYVAIIFNLSLIMCAVGIFLIYKGFRLWYIRLQIHQDIIVRNQAKMSKREVLNQMRNAQALKTDE